MPIDEKLSHWADKEFSRKNYPSSAEKLQMGLERCPDDLDARQKLRLVARKNLVENPVKGLGKMKKQGQIAKLKSIMQLKKKSDEVVVAAEKVLFEDPNDIATLQVLARAFEQMELYEHCKWVLEDAIKLDGENVNLWKNLGLLYQEKLNSPDDALACYDKVLKFDPQDNETRKLQRTIEAEKAMIADKDGNKESKDISAALKDQSEAMRDEVLRKIIRNADDARAQVRFFLQDLEEDPKNFKIMEKIADRYRQGELFKECIEYLEKVLELEPANETVRMRIGEVKLQMAESQKEKIYLAFRKNPKSTELREKYQKAMIYELKMGLSVYKGWVEAHPTDLRLKHKYGQYLYMAKKYKEALSMFQKAAGDPKIQGEANEYLARCFMALDKPKLAIKPLDKCLERASEGSDTWKEIIYLKAKCYVALSEEDTAQSLFEKIYEIDIDFKDVADLI